uniref:Ionotropic glutamate receptor C-terminal domain-containing protein n=1 Tax=Anopheles funestus TaxID=62324 RepID=A0A182RW37_ANOFN
MESFAIFIAVLPNDAIESVRSVASMLYRCVIHYFLYDPVTLTGVWAMERNGQRIHLVDGKSSGWNMHGQTMIFLNMNLERETTHDIAMGQMIATRHNGSFAMAQSLMQCHDYMFSGMYAVALGSFVTLPELMQLCFIVPKSPPKTIFSILSDPFDVYCWGAFVFTICMISVLLCLFGESYRRYNVGMIFLELVMHALNGPSHRFQGRFEVRIIGLFMVMNIVLLSCYQSLIISLMSSDRYEPELETIEQINDTCQFQREIFLESLGYRFKNTFYTFELYGTYEQIWANKICHMVMCSDINTGHTLIETQSSNYDANGYSFNDYFRFSKARIRSSAVMYLIMPYSPMRPLIKRYATSYNEGHLHHLPLLKERKSSFLKQNTHVTIVIASMQAKDLMIVWLIFLIGCAVLRDHIERSAVFIAVVSNDLLDSLKKYAARRYKCMMHYYHYDPVTYVGSWTIEQESKMIYTLEQVGSGWNLRGQQLIYLNADSDRETPIDLELGRTIAQRHNGSFKEADGIMECYDYIYSQTYGISMGSFTILPEMVQMCFIVPRSTPKSIFSILLDPFDPYSWGAFGLTVAMVSALLSLFGESYQRYNVGLISLELVMNALNGPTHQFEGRFEVRMIGLFMLMNVVLISCYQSLVISLMSSVRYDTELDTIEQVNETCYFERDRYLEILGYRFKNIFYTFDLYGTYEHMWTNKVCRVITCSDVSMGHMRLETQSLGFDDEDDPDFDRYYRYSKAHLRPSVGMYSIVNHSPMRNFISRYVASYNEGHLHHWPLLKMGKMASMRRDTHASIIVVGMSAEDLMLVADRHYYHAITRIFIFPESELDSFLSEVPSIKTCISYLFAYNPHTLNGSWTIYQSADITWTLEEFSHFNQNMRGYDITYQMMDFMRDTTYDLEIGNTIARRHNATFTRAMGISLSKCIDFELTPVYIGESRYIPLPDKSELCVIVPKSAPKSVFLVLIDPYDHFSWIAFGLTIIAISLVLFWFSKSSRHTNIILIVLEMLMIVLNGPTHQLDDRFERFVVGLFMLLSIVVISGYQSLVISFISSPRYDPQLDTFDAINDTCLFLYDAQMVNFGYNFKNFHHTREIFESIETMWNMKWCGLVTCSEAQYVMTHIGAVGRPREMNSSTVPLLNEEQWKHIIHMFTYFRYSKARAHSMMAMYNVAEDSPVHHNLAFYTQAFIEGRLEYFPVLKKSTPIPREILEDTVETISVRQTNLEDLLIAWMLYCLGITLSMIANHHYHLLVTRIFIFPESELDSFLTVAPSIKSCTPYLFAYNPHTLNGSWSIYQSTDITWTLEDFPRFNQNMRGYEISYLSTDLLRDSTYDIEIGDTIAQRHNATFKQVLQFMPSKCIDNIYSPMYLGQGQYIPLPDTSELCFIVPKSARKSVFLVLLDPYDRFCWIAFGLTVVVISLLLFWFGNSSRHTNIILIVLEMLMIVLNGPTHRLDDRFERLVVGLFMLLSIVVLSGYQSLVISFISSPRYDPQLDTFDAINDTCLFMYDPSLSNLGYHFKNTHYTYEVVESTETMWNVKWCALVACSEAQYVMTHVGDVDKPGKIDPGSIPLYDEEQWKKMKHQLKYFRYSKARVQLMTAMYHVSDNSPVRHHLAFYTQAFIEGHLQYYPMLKNSKTKPREILEETLESANVEQMTMRDLLIAWLLYCLGMLLSLSSLHNSIEGTLNEGKDKGNHYRDPLSALYVAVMY